MMASLSYHIDTQHVLMCNMWDSSFPIFLTNTFSSVLARSFGRRPVHMCKLNIQESAEVLTDYDLLLISKEES